MDRYLMMIRFSGQPHAIPTPADAPVNPTLWRSTTNPAQHLLAIEFPDRQHADAFEKEIVSSTPPPDDCPIPDVRGISIKYGSGATPTQSAVGDYLAMATIQTGPGLGEKLEDQADEVLQTFRSLPGYLGYLVGANVSLSEEVWVVATWQSEPPTPRADDDIKYACYQRIDPAL
jgi:hypothetical protein